MRQLSGTPTAVFTEIQLIGQFLVLGISILIQVIKTLWSCWQAKSHLISLLCYGTQLFEIEILISSVFAYRAVFR